MKSLPESFRLTDKVSNAKIVRKTYELNKRFTPFFKYLCNNDYYLRDSVSDLINTSLTKAIQIANTTKYNKRDIESLRSTIIATKVRIDLAFNDDLFVYENNKRSTNIKTTALKKYAELTKFYEDYTRYLDDLMKIIDLEVRKTEISSRSEIASIPVV